MHSSARWQWQSRGGAWGAGRLSAQTPQELQSAAAGRPSGPAGARAWRSLGEAKGPTAAAWAPGPGRPGKRTREGGGTTADRQRCLQPAATGPLQVAQEMARRWQNDEASGQVGKRRGRFRQARCEGHGHEREAPGGPESSVGRPFQARSLPGPQPPGR